MIALSHIAKSFGDRTLFAEVSLHLEPGARYGLCGANGSGKTTLLRILSGEEAPTDGERIVPSATRIGVLEQDRFIGEEQRIVEVAMMGDAPAYQALMDKERLLAAAAPDAHAIAEAEERIAHTDGYALAARAGAILEGLGIGAAAQQRPLSTLSGGFRLRVLLGQTLVGRPEVLLLDEPTNHLDILTIHWLEGYLRRFEGTAVIISHDHRFLEQVATHILDVDYQTVTLYSGGYRRFETDKRLTRERKEAEIARRQQEIDDKKAFVERFRAKNTKARQAQSRLKQIERIEIEELPRSSRRAPAFRFEQTRRSGREVLRVSELSKAYGEEQVLSRVSFELRRGERLAVIGANGLGKSTLLKLLVGAIEADAGEVSWGYQTAVGYFAQDHHELLTDGRTTVLDYLWDSCPSQPTSFVRGQLGRLLFSGEDVDKRVGSLSGGEAARLIFSRLIVSKPNVLVLDEPTNHLDLESIEALAEALEAYPGTLLLVSHDRWLVSRLASRIIELGPGGIEDYPGSYQDYLTRSGRDHLDAGAVLAAARRDKSAARERAEAAGKAGAGSDYAEHKQRRARHRKLLARRDAVTAELERADERLDAIRARWCEPGFYQQTSAEKQAALQREEQSLEPQIGELMAEWEAIELELERLGES